MQIKVERLREALKLLQPVAPRKPTLEVLSNVLLQDGAAIASDLETMVRIDLPEVGGQCLVPVREVLETLKYVPGYDTLEITSEEKKLTVTWDDGSASYVVPKVEDYPSFNLPMGSASDTLEGDALMGTLVELLPYAAKEESRPALTGVALFLGETIEAVAADGFRLSSRPVPGTWPAEEVVIIPPGTIRILSQLWQRLPPAPIMRPGASLARMVVAKRLLRLSIEEKQLSFAFGRVTVLSQRIEGNFPNYKQLIPTDLPKTVRVLAAEIDRAVRQIAAVARETGAVRLEWSGEGLNLSGGPEDARVTTRLPVRTEGDAGRIAVHYKYLKEYLDGKEGLVTLSAKDETSPLVLRHGKSAMAVVMPMHVSDWASQKEPTATTEPQAEAPADAVIPEQTDEGVEEAMEGEAQTEPSVSSEAEAGELKEAEPEPETAAPPAVGPVEPRPRRRQRKGR
ncbi:MAG: hypothetical protein HYX85_00260 [Chloroflexi bacterium]|nr:hypothetical protein [Chloroflexota bacterium]